MRKTLFAGPHIFSEYMDNTSRIGSVILNKNLHCHKKCERQVCAHPYSIDLTTNPYPKRKCKYVKKNCKFQSSAEVTTSHSDECSLWDYINCKVKYILELKLYVRQILFSKKKHMKINCMEHEMKCTRK